MPHTDGQERFLENKENDMINYEEINNTHDLINTLCDGKGMMLEVHNLRTFAPVLLNRDMNGEAKTAEIGGAVRTIVSSQCRKAAIRRNALNSRSERTRHAPKIIAYYMKEQHPELSHEYLDAVMDTVCKLFGEDKKKASYHMTSTVITIGDEDIKRIAKAIEDEFGLETPPKDDKKNLESKLSTLVKSCKIDYDVCLFGRMSTNQIISTVDSASYFGFSFSVNENCGDVDTFIAQDTFNDQCALFGAEVKTDLGQGAAHINDRTINADTFYEYCGFSIPAYLENVMYGVDFSDKELVKERVRKAFEYLFEVLKLCVVQVPTAMQHQMCSANKPVSYITLTQEAQNLTCGDAFERKVVATDDKSIMDVAVDRFVEDANDDTFFYGKYVKKYWLSKKYENRIKGAESMTLMNTIKDLEDYFYGKAGI